MEVPVNAKLSLIFQRRSVREFSPGEVPAHVIQDMLEAAMAAPSACCKDPWDFVVVKDLAMRVRMADGLPNGKFLTSAALGIVVCGNIERAHAGELSYMLQDCSAAMQNLLMAAEGLGFGACWLGVHPREDRIAMLRNLLGLPEKIIPIGVAAVGVPAVKMEARTRFKESAVHWEKW
jgi:nitroreductase